MKDKILNTVGSILGYMIAYVIIITALCFLAWGLHYVFLFTVKMNIPAVYIAMFLIACVALLTIALIITRMRRKEDNGSESSI